MALNADQSFICLALQLAEKGRGKTRPNPMVGAVIVKDGLIVGKGYHHAAGKPHAEILALKEAADKAKGATLYLNLEPCCHIGRTGPCTTAIIKAGISRVVYSVNDPDPRVNGKGARILRKAGIEVKSGVMKDAAMMLNDSYLGYFTNQRPYVIVKAAQTLDGRIATTAGDSRWISGPDSLKLAHNLRAETDAVLVGGETVRQDNPRLTVRNVKGDNPYRIVVSSSAKLSSQCHLISQNRDFKTIVATTRDNVKKLNKINKRQGLIYWTIKSNRTGLIDISNLVQKADDFGLRSMLVEGGGKLITSFLKSKMADKIVIVTAPMILGEGLSAVNDLKIKNMKNTLRFKKHYFFECGSDSVFVGYPDWK